MFLVYRERDLPLLTKRSSSRALCPHLALTHYTKLLIILLQCKIIFTFSHIFTISFQFVWQAMILPMGSQSSIIWVVHVRFHRNQWTPTIYPCHQNKPLIYFCFNLWFLLYFRRLNVSLVWGSQHALSSCCCSYLHFASCCIQKMLLCQQFR